MHLQTNKTKRTKNSRLLPKVTRSFLVLVCLIVVLLLDSPSTHPWLTTNHFFGVLPETAAEHTASEPTFVLPMKKNHTDSLPFHHPRNHPRVGARDENGSYGFVADPYLVRGGMIQRMTELNNCSSCIGSLTRFLPLTSYEYHEICNKSVGEGFGEKTLNEVRFLRPVRVVPSVSPLAPKILCVVYTHEKVRDRVSVIAETWGWRCDGFFAASTITVRDPTQPGFGSIDLVHRGEEEYKNMWQKTRSILAYIFEHYLDKFDYYHICGDDVFVIPENLKKYLLDLETRRDGIRAHRLIFGVIMGQGKDQYIGGGPGYTLNREALRFYNQESGLMDDCYPEERVSAEDRYISRCFQQKDVWPFQPVDELTGLILSQGWSPEWMVKDTSKKVGSSPENPYTMVPEDLVANETFAWHIIERTATHTIAMKRYHAHFYQTCPDDSIRAHSMTTKEFLQKPVLVK